MINLEFHAPLRFEPLFRPYIWGGRRLETVLHKQIPSEGIWAESWEIVDHGTDQSIVDRGPYAGKSLRALIELAPRAVIGENASKNDQLPLLLKYLDCQRVLSVQVHPDDNYAAKMSPPDLGKTEAWYVVEACDDSLIYAGLKEGVGRVELAKAIANGDIESCLHSFHPKLGDCVFIPAGTVHALGAGLIVAEIQQASDTTFRLYDWNRLGADNKPRPLHVDEALEVIDFNIGPIFPVKPSPVTTSPVTTSGFTNLVTCDRFVLDEVRSILKGFSLGGQFAIATVARGNATIKKSGGADLNNAYPEASLSVGQSVLIPASIKSIDLTVEPNAIVLLARPPQICE